MGKTPTRAMMDALEGAFDHFNERLFERRLPPLFLTTSRSHNRRVLGFFTPESWAGPEGFVWELSLTPRCTSMGARDVLSVLVHEMAHELDELQGTTPKSPGWHGKAWFKIMRDVGLEPKPNGRSRVSVSHAIIEGGRFARAYESLPAWVVLPFKSTEAGACIVPEVPEGEVEEGPVELVATKTGLRARYLCPGCATTMRGPFGRKLICGDCGVEYIETGR